MEIIKKLPLPVVGLMLGLAAFGNIMGTYSPTIRNIIGLIAGIIAILVTIKIVVIPSSLKAAFDNPVAGSVMGAYPMGLMLLSTYLKPYIGSGAKFLWMASILIHLIFILVFTGKYILKFNIKKVFPSYFVMYVGIVVASVTSPAYGMQSFGQAIFWLGLCSYLILLPIVIYRVVKIKNIPSPAQPTLIIFAAPASLLLTGYLKAFAEKNANLIYGLAILALIMVLYALVKLPKLIKMSFVPAYSAFTFPLVISAIAFGGFNNFMTMTNQPSDIYLILKNGLTLIAGIMVFYVLYRYTLFLLKKPEEKKISKAV